MGDGQMCSFHLGEGNEEMGKRRNRETKKQGNEAVGKRGNWEMRKRGNEERVNEGNKETGK